VLVSPVEDPAVTNVLTNTAIVPDDLKQVLQDYDSLMIALTQKFSATLATIAEAVKRGEVSSEQAREMSAEQYQVTHMQFELLSLWRGIGNTLTDASGKSYTWDFENRLSRSRKL
jgi:hypothetical protein